MFQESIYQLADSCDGVVLGELFYLEQACLEGIHEAIYDQVDQPALAHHLLSMLTGPSLTSKGIQVDVVILEHEEDQLGDEFFDLDKEW